MTNFDDSDHLLQIHKDVWSRHVRCQDVLSLCKT